MERIKFESVKRVSIEKEFSLLSKKKMPIRRLETQGFIHELGKMKDKANCFSDIDDEVAFNAVEVKFSLITPSMIACAMKNARSAILKIAFDNELVPVWTNQNIETPKKGGYNDCFTIKVFPELLSSFTNINAIHIHFEVEEAKLIHMYKQMNILAPWFIMNSKEGDFNILKAISQRVASMGELYLPQDFHTTDDYKAFTLQGSKILDKRLRQNKGWEKIVDNESFDITKLYLLPKGLFHQARLRMDLKLENGNMSIEFRPIVGLNDVEREIQLIHAAIFAFEEASAASQIISIEKTREFYHVLNKRCEGYKIAEQFVQEAHKKRTGRYL